MMIAVQQAFERGELRRSAMDNKPAQNIQDSFLNTARKERTSITIYLLSGVKLTGRIRSFDKYSVVLETNNQEQLIFKHAISTVAMGRSVHGHGEKLASAMVSAGNAEAASATTHLANETEQP
jgi:host factor-I protein